MRISAEFVISAASARDLPGDGVPEVALVGRSNVGKSSLINALARQRVARTSARPGKTRLANIYRMARGSGSPLYLVDLPGYGYARGGAASAREFADLTHTYFGRAGRAGQIGQAGQARQARLAGTTRSSLPGVPGSSATAAPTIGALLLLDARHPGLESDVEAWAWLQSAVDEAAVVATKIDKLARGERIRAQRELESVFQDSVLPVSAATGEGLDELWKLIDRLANSQQPNRDSNSSPRSHAATARPSPKKAPPRR